MARKYFQNLPVVEYRGGKVRNLLLSAHIVKDVLDNAQAYYPYTLKDGETPTSIAFDYYGSVEYVWLVLMSNGMIDPYTDWHKSTQNFNSYLEDKYGSVTAAMATIDHYQHATDPTYPFLSPTSYQYLSDADKASFVAVTAYDYENELNESKRQIKLIDNRFAARIAHELEVKLNG